MLITADNARELGARGIAAYRAQRQAEKARLELIDKLLLQHAESAALATAIPTDKPDQFTTKRLMRVRKQLERLDGLLAATDDSKVIKELADATTRLQTQEQQLSGRPLVASVKPTQPSKAQRTTQGPSLPPATG